MKTLTNNCNLLGIETIDVYGDFNSTVGNSYLRTFEAEVAGSLGKEDAVFMPSGVMAQNIALLIHHNSNDVVGRRFACHHSSHLLLHEEEAFRHLLSMEPLIISTEYDITTDDEKAYDEDEMIGVPPLTYSDVKRAFTSKGGGGDEGRETTGLSTFILELPHRELGGKLSPWEDVLKMKTLCAERAIKFHCDGARLFEASAGYNLPLTELCDPFDSVYVSFYKGLGGIAGAMLVGDAKFCTEARLWLRRFGGNLYTLLPYAIGGWAGYRQYITNKDDDHHHHHPPITFGYRRDKMRRIVSTLSCKTELASQVVSFDPNPPPTNMVHGYIRASSVKECLEARDVVEREEGIRVFNKVREIEEEDAAYRLGYRAKFEYSIGEYNGSIDDSTYLRGWNKLAAILVKSG